jgi:hypothetical protein
MAGARAAKEEGGEASLSPSRLVRTRASGKALGLLLPRSPPTSGSTGLRWRARDGSRRRRGVLEKEEEERCLCACVVLGGGARCVLI